MVSDNIIVSVSRSLLGVYPEREAAAVARMVAEECFGISLTAAYSGTARRLDAAEKELLENIVQRLRKGEPVQYVLERADFMGYSFHVEPGVLIPRPETEKLVSCVLEDIKDGSNLEIIDAGTGSGVIAVSLKRALPEAHVFAFDISRKALRVARRNASEQSLDVIFFETDMLSATLPEGPFDAIVSNPPYVRKCEQSTMTMQVKAYEPGVALFVTDDYPLVFYQALGGWARKSLKPGGALYVEINAALSSDTSELFKGAGFDEVTVHKDQFDKDRVIVCRKIGTEN